MCIFKSYIVLVHVRVCVCGTTGSMLTLGNPQREGAVGRGPQTLGSTGSPQQLYSLVRFTEGDPTY